jgi:hypothetical protein
MLCMSMRIAGISGRMSCFHVVGEVVKTEDEQTWQSPMARASLQRVCTNSPFALDLMISSKEKAKKEGVGSSEATGGACPKR